MSNIITRSNLDYALAYAKIGWHIFPVYGAVDGKCRCKRLCQSPAKHPVAHLAPRGQDNATTDEAIIRGWWGAMPEAGIAVFLAPSGLMAIDLDPRNGGIETMEQIEAERGALTSDVMAFTQGGGEHRIFTIPAGVTLPGKLGVGIDIKLNGYIVIEPTRGVSGEYSWEASSDPLDGAIPSPLPDWMRDLASPAALVSSSAPSTRHITKEQVSELQNALMHIPADDRDMWVKIGMALHSVGQAGFTLWDEWSQQSSKYNPVDTIRVWRSFRAGSGINYETVFFLAAEHGFHNVIQPKLPDAVPLESVSVVKPQPPTSAPSSLLSPPGILGTVADWINATSRKAQPQFSVQAAIAFCSTVMGRRYCTDQKNWPSLYLLNIGKSASGKEHAKWAIEQLLIECKLDHLIGPSGYTSAAGVTSSLCHQPSHITIMDEFGRMLESASIKGNSMAQGTLTTLMEAWGRCDGQIRPPGRSTAGMTAKEVAKMESRTVYNPALTLLGMSTPETFFGALGTAAARDGFLNRFLIVETDIGRQVGCAAKAPPVPSSVILWAETASAFEGLVSPDVNPSVSVTPKVIHIRAEAADLFDAYDAECIAQMDAHDDAGLSEMFGRHNEQAMRLALVAAVADGWQAINADHAAWAINYVRHYGKRTVDRIHECVSDSDFGAVNQQVLALIRGHNGMTERDINRKSRKFAAMDKRGKIGVLDNLAFIGDIVRAESVGVNGKKTQKWFAVDHDASVICQIV